MNLDRVPPAFFSPPSVSAALKLNVGDVTELSLSRTALGFQGTAQVRDKGQLYRSTFRLNPAGIFTGGECGCGRKGCPHLARALLSPALERELERAGGGAAPLPEPAPAQPGGSPDLPDEEAPAVPLASPLRQWLAAAADLTGEESGGGNRGPLTLKYELSVTLRPRTARETLTLRVRRASRELERGALHALSVFPLPHALRWHRGDGDGLPRFAAPDRDVLTILSLGGESGVVGGEEAWYLGEHPLTDTLLARLLGTGRLYWNGAVRPLTFGPERATVLGWQMDAGGVQRPTLSLPPGVRVLPVSPRWYVDERALELGRITSALPPALENAFLHVPPVPPAQAAGFAEALRESFPALGDALPLPQPVRVRRLPAEYQPLLTLREERVTVSRRKGWRTQTEERTLGVAHLAHLYDGQPITVERQNYVDGVLSLRGRDPVAEKRSAGQLTRTGLKRLQSLQPRGDHVENPEAANLYAFAQEAEWQRFLMTEVPKLEARGFRVEVDPSFPYRYAEVEDWFGEAGDEGGWFTLELGVIVDGERLSLIPILVSLIAERPELFTPEALAALKDDDVIPARLPDGRRLALPAGRVRAILSVLVELHLRELPEGPLKLPLLDAARLAALDEALQARWLGAERLLDLGRRLRSFRGVADVEPPEGLRAELRPYQRQGLSWLQFLREYDLGGILADDMGLGKAQPLDAGVLTPSGWVRMGDLQVGDFVIGRDGRPTQVIGVYPQGERPIYHVTLTDGASVEVDEEHLWAVNTPVRKRRGLPERVLTTARIMADLADAAGNLKHYVPMVEPVRFAERDLPVGPYTLGALLGDGCLRYSVEVSSEDELVGSLSLPQGVSARPVERLSHKVSTDRLVTEGRWTPNPLKDALRALGLHGLGSREKFIPTPYLLGSVDQRLALLQGLLDTDGHAGVVVEYTSVSEALARGVVELTQSLGGTARIRRKRTTPTYRGERREGLAWRVTLKLPPHLDPFRLPEKLAAYRRPTKYPPTRGIRRIEFVGVKEAQCIAVAAPDHLYVTEEYIVTHNTLQTLAHLQTEKVSGRADRPSLVIAPTSVLGNWRAEAARFTPGLKVLTLHGPNRKEDFARVPDHDLVLSTYPLLPRDVDALREHDFHLLVLDEAQNIKNPRSAAAKAAGALKARHRLALTGTPLENHLGELWSQFNFLTPGLLYDEKTFRELYRTPVEKQGDRARQAALAARVKPFILRREKRDVAHELPPKTEIPVRVTLDGDQRDLYETVRVTMLERVREELDARGLARSTVAILDALLKLRQAATDPRLVRLETARKVRGSAKLDWLTGNLPQMVEEGRRVLIFSQFATLLGLLEDTLTGLGIGYAKLTGQTKNRAAQIERFQRGEVPVFLISLKAGGVGLNLTAADTVIHLDPWWNPAAENQATDRAYRIGQDKPVFVYKLIAAGSVEERILDLQHRKAALAQGVLDGGLTSATQLTTGDLERLFAPLEEEAGPVG
ncbi:SNF2-related protein [Deinococcus planocerae]|uniref:SNF2-related protein n=1 Tax=Deinococcus planocerae TaxID=1737569 RepID=UPI001FE6C4CB|nr:SNF2-related protein [Deinococcus planocerae]